MKAFPLGMNESERETMSYPFSLLVKNDGALTSHSSVLCELSSGAEVTSLCALQPEVTACVFVCGVTRSDWPNCLLLLISQVYEPALRQTTTQQTNLFSAILCFQSITLSSSGPLTVFTHPHTTSFCLFLLRGGDYISGILIVQSV
jgi:hypothetical protein